VGFAGTDGKTGIPVAAGGEMARPGNGGFLKWWARAEWLPRARARS
jgi:hypothetical protein